MQFSSFVQNTIAILAFIFMAGMNEHAQAQVVAQKPSVEVLDTSVEFPPELVRWSVIPKVNPVFQGAAGEAWDAKIRERGWIV